MSSTENSNALQLFSGNNLPKGMCFLLIPVSSGRSNYTWLYQYFILFSAPRGLPYFIPNYKTLVPPCYSVHSLSFSKLTSSFLIPYIADRNNVHLYIYIYIYIQYVWILKSTAVSRVLPYTLPITLFHMTFLIPSK